MRLILSALLAMAVLAGVAAQASADQYPPPDWHEILRAQR
jgi:hypothetical protein